MTDYLSNIMSSNIVRCVYELAGTMLLLACLASVGVAQYPPTSAGRLPDPSGAAEEIELPEEIKVVEVRIEGNRGFSNAKVAGQLMTRAGRRFDHDIIQSDVRKLFHLGWFSNVEPYYEDSSKGRIVIFKVTERPTIRYIKFLGANKISAKKLEKQVGLKRGETIDPYRVEEGRNTIEEFYHEKGYNRVQVSIEEGASVQDQGVVYVINEGVSQKVWSVDFIGNTFVSDRRLKTQIQSKPGMLWVFGGHVDPKKIEADKNTLTAYYRAFGFFQARVEAIKEFNENGDKLNLKFVIHEGPRYNIRRVSFVGNARFSSDVLLEKLELQHGKPFNQFKMDHDRIWLQDLYGSQGHAFADIHAEPRFLEEPGEMDLVYRIEEGKQWRVGRIFVHIGGPNPHTQIHTALNRLSLRPGEIIDTREIKASERRLRACGLFRNEPAQGITPKVVYRIPELHENALAEQPGRPQFRGQSPDLHGARQPSRHQAYKPATRGLSENASSTSAAPSNRGSGIGSMSDALLEVHVYATSETTQVQPSSTTSTETNGTSTLHTSTTSTSPTETPREQPVHSAYQNLFETPAARQQNSNPSLHQPTNGPIIRGQSPLYGGQPIGATGPDAVRTQMVQPRVAQANPVFQPGTPVSPSSPDPLPPPGGPQPLYPYPQIGPVQPPFNDLLDIYVDGEETETGHFMAGASVNSDLGLFGNFVIDERNFNWRRFPTSWEDVRNGTAWRGAGQRFRLEAAPGSQVNRYLVSFQEPYLWQSPISLGLSGFFYDRRYVDWDEQRVGGRVSLGYQWTDRDIAAKVAYRGANVKISNPAMPTPPELAEVVGSNTLHGFSVTVTNDTRDSAFLATTGHFIEMMFEQVVGTYDYPRATLDMRQYFLLHERPDRSGRHVLSYGTRLGFTGSNTPIYEHFFAGGFSTLRGFDYRGASPLNGPVRVGGEFQWLNSVEYLYPISADDMIRGIVFCDFGTVEPDVQIEDFRVAPGVGLRIVVPAMGPAPIALDIAWPIVRAEGDEQEQFSFHVGFQR